MPASQAAEPAPLASGLKDCAQIAAATDRLACYDQLAGRAPAEPPPGETSPGATPAADAAQTPPSTSKLLPKDAPPVNEGSPAAGSSLMSKFWELDPGDKRGVFNFTGYKPNYVLPLHLSSGINRSPHSPTQAAVAVPNYRNTEAKFQLSLRAKLAQDVGLPGADLWFAYTQQALWQIWNPADSRPFRNTDYEPEAIYIVPTPKDWRALPGGWQWRYTQLAIAHQSNGQSDPLSRSWNRAYLGAGFDRGDFGFTTRYVFRFKESYEDDNNPDLLYWRGRADFQLAWSGGLHTASLLYRTNISGERAGRLGSLQLEWTYPVFRAQPNGLRWYAQLFTGYGETLTDYNYRQTSIGLGVTFLQF